jgi:ABC-type cobalt transport system substrate-binding protein
MKLKKSNLLLILLIIILLVIIVYLAKGEKNYSIGKDLKCELAKKAEKLA